MLACLQNPTLFQILSFAGAASAILGALIAGLAYRGRQNERYSILNHFISELGEVGISRLAWVFNLGLILCGLCLLPASLSLDRFCRDSGQRWACSPGLFPPSVSRWWASSR
jgi:hypothetical membrane protein